MEQSIIQELKNTLSKMSNQYSVSLVEEFLSVLDTIESNTNDITKTYENIKNHASCVNDSYLTSFYFKVKDYLKETPESINYLAMITRGLFENNEIDISMVDDIYYGLSNLQKDINELKQLL